MKNKSLLLCLLLFLLGTTVIACSQAETPGNEVNSEGENAGSNAQSGADLGEETAPEANAVSFSKEGGFYEEGFTLEMTCPEGSEIYYTMDGTDPTTSHTALVYSKGIKIYDNTGEPNIYSAVTDIALGGYEPPKFNVDKGMVIRAVAKDAAGEYGKIVTNSYFIGKEAPYYSDFRVISMVTDGDYLFDPDTGAYMIGSGYYEWLESEDYVEMDSGDANNPTNYNKHGKESEFPVSIQIFEEGTAVYADNVGARLSGNWSRAGAQKSFRFYARKEMGNSKHKYAFFDDLLDSEGELMEKFDKVTLRNGGNDHILHFRDAFVQELADGLDLDYMASEPCILFLNGEFWGFYLLREKPDDYYVKSHYGIPDEEVAVIKNGEVESGEDEDLEEYREFTSWAATADMSVEENYEEFCSKMDVQSFMDYVTVETYINNNDWTNGYTNNWIAWKSKIVDPSLPKADGKWRFVLYDLDMSCGLYGSEETSYKYDSLKNMHADQMDSNLMEILRNLCRNEEFRKQFYDNYISVIDTCFYPEDVRELLRVYVEEYSPATKDTLRRFGADWAADCYEQEAADLQKFFDKRPEYAKRYLDAFVDEMANAKPREEIDVESEEGNLATPVSRWFSFGDASFDYDSGAKAYYVNVPNTKENSWEIQCGPMDMTLEKGEKYRVTFEASCSEEAKLEVFLQYFDGAEYPTVWLGDMVLGKDLNTYEFTAVNNIQTNDIWKLCFCFGHGKGDYTIQNVVLEKAE